MEATPSFGYWVHRRRKALDMTQAQLARQVACATVTIKKIEADERRPSREMAERLAECLAVEQGQRQAFFDAALAKHCTNHLPLDVEPVSVPQRGE